MSPRLGKCGTNAPGGRDIEAAEVGDGHATDRFPGSRVLDGAKVDAITAFLFHRGGHADPVRLQANAGKSFQGSIVLGMGFTFDDTDRKGVASPLAEMERLIEADPRNREVIFPYIGGEEVNTSPTHVHHRYVINFRDWPLRRARPARPASASLEDVDSREFRARERGHLVRPGRRPAMDSPPKARDCPRRHDARTRERPGTAAAARPCGGCRIAAREPRNRAGGDACTGRIGTGMVKPGTSGAAAMTCRWKWWKWRRGPARRTPSGANGCEVVSCRWTIRDRWRRIGRSWRGLWRSGSSRNG